MLELFLVRTITFILNLLPISWRRAIVSRALRLVAKINQKHLKVAERNLSRAFPEKDAVWRRQIINLCYESLARMLVDLFRLHTISESEIRETVIFPEHEKFFELITSKRPVILAAGHLGNFELLARSLALNGAKSAVVAREFRPKGLNRWWTWQRESCGNIVVPRDGALKAAIKCLKIHKPIGVLFDQNITRQFADFIDWFGIPAATSRLVGLLAVRSQALVIVFSIKYLDNGKYQVVYKVRDFESIYLDSTISQNAKVFKINSEISSDYVEMIKDNPGEWFWMHRRWKTRPDGEPETFYSDL
jgi:KDO2-lipid IV(A) lauroyltransferase